MLLHGWMREWPRWSGSLFGHINNKSFTDPLLYCLVKMAGYWPASLFLAFLLTSNLSGSINMQKRTWLILSYLDLMLSLISQKRICTDIKLVSSQSHFRGKVTYLLLKSRHRTLVSCFRICSGNGLLINIFMIWLNHKQETTSTMKTYH